MHVGPLGQWSLIIYRARLLDHSRILTLLLFA
jgi:hypothetical protein